MNANLSSVLDDLLNLEFSPVAVGCLEEPYLESFQNKMRICKGILDAGRGETIQISRENNACLGAGWHLGFHNPGNPQVINMIRKLVVEGEKLLSSYQALDHLLSQMEALPDNAAAHFVLSPCETAEFEPELVIFICNPEEACRLLTLSVFVGGEMPKIKIGGPTCRMAIMYPLLTGEVNISLYDYTARRQCKVEKDKLLVSVPYARLLGIVESIEGCSAGRARVELPREVQVFLQERLAKKQEKGN
jgi:uncharacterized protein (DUF169 family)